MIQKKGRIHLIWSKFKTRKWYSKIAILGSFLLLLGFLSILMLFLSVKWSIVTKLPSDQEIQSINNPLTTEIYSREGKLYGKFYDENRGDLDTSDLTTEFKQALLATEDIRFYNHSGIDYRALARVAVKSIILRKRSAGGGSTLTQQLAKNLYPRKHFRILSLPLNKFREISIAQKLEKNYTKDEILLLYANTISFGERAFGLYTASNRFFGKAPAELSLEEAATLVGILKAPTYYSPKRNPERCKQRRNTVLKQMHKYEFITDEARKKAENSELTLNYKPLTESTGLARYFQQKIKEEFDTWAANNPKESGDIYHIKRDGLRIYTTLDYDLQIAAEHNMQSHMKNLQSIFDRSWKSGNKYGPGDRYFKNEISSGQLGKRFNDMTDAEKEEVLSREADMDLWTWNEEENKIVSVEDSIRHYMSLLHTGVLGVNPKTGEILSYIGGIDYGAFQYDNITSKRQVGSTFKPIVYLKALQRNLTPCDYFANEKRTYSDYKDWTPENSDGKYGGYLSVKEAMTRSVNTVSVQMMFHAGLVEVVDFAKQLGIQSKLPEVPSLVLGTADISLWEMVTAYSAIINGGTKPDLFGITKITDSKGNVLFEKKIEVIAKKEIDPSYSMIREIMNNVTAQGTGARLYSYDIPFEVAGKTGTTQNQTDGWFIGATEDYVIGAWVGAQNRGIHFRNLGTGSGGRTALPLVGRMFEYVAATGYTPQSYSIDSLIVSCPDSIGQEEYAYLAEHPGDFDGIYAKRNDENLDIFDILFGGEDEGEVIIGEPRARKKSTRATRTRKYKTKKKRQRNRELERFKKEFEKSLKDIFKKDNKKRRN